MGTEGTILINSFLRTGFEMFTLVMGANYVGGKPQSKHGLVIPVGDELNELGYNHMFMDMFNSMESKSAPKRNFLRWLCQNSILMLPTNQLNPNCGNPSLTSGVAAQE